MGYLKYRVLLAAAVAIQCGSSTTPQPTHVAECLSTTESDQRAWSREGDSNLWRSRTAAVVVGCGVFGVETTLDLENPDPDAWLMKENLKACNACDQEMAMDFHGIARLGTPRYAEALDPPEYPAAFGLEDSSGSAYVTGCGYGTIRTADDRKIAVVSRVRLMPAGRIVSYRERSLFYSFYHGAIHTDAPYWRDPVSYDEILRTFVYLPNLLLADEAPNESRLLGTDFLCASNGISKVRSDVGGEEALVRVELELLAVPPKILDRIRDLEH